MKNARVEAEVFLAVLCADGDRLWLLLRAEMEAMPSWLPLLRCLVIPMEGRDANLDADGDADGSVNDVNATQTGRYE